MKKLFSGGFNLLQTGIAWAIYFLINLVFCIKYNPSEAIHPLYILVLYPVIVIGIYKTTAYLRIQQKNYFFLTLAFVIFLFSFFLLNYTGYLMDYAGRWPVFAGRSDGLKICGAGYLQLFCLLIFLISLFCWRTKINIGGILLLFALSPAFWREIAVRSDSLCIMLLVFVFITFHFYYPAFWNKHKTLSAVIAGLFLCTELLVAVPLLLYFFRLLSKYSAKERTLFVLTVLACFFVLLLPFLFGEQGGLLKHLEYHSFILQLYHGNSLQFYKMNIWLLGLGFILLLYAAFAWKQMRDMYFLAGLFLFLFILAAFIHTGIKDGFYSSIFEAKSDLSSFNVCIPYFLFYIHEMKKRTFDFSKYHIDY